MESHRITATCSSACFDLPPLPEGASTGTLLIATPCGPPAGETHQLLLGYRRPCGKVVLVTWSAESMNQGFHFPPWPQSPELWEVVDEVRIYRSGALRGKALSRLLACRPGEQATYRKMRLTRLSAQDLAALSTTFSEALTLPPHTAAWVRTGQQVPKACACCAWC